MVVFERVCDLAVDTVLDAAVECHVMHFDVSEAFSLFCARFDRLDLEILQVRGLWQVKQGSQRRTIRKTALDFQQLVLRDDCGDAALTRLAEFYQYIISQSLS